MSNHGKYFSANRCNPVLENKKDLLLGWFKKLDINKQEELIRDLLTKFQSNISFEKHTSEKDEDFRFQELLNQLSSKSKLIIGSKILKSYLSVHHHGSPISDKMKNQFHPFIDHEPEHVSKAEEFIKSKSLDSRHGKSGGLQKQDVGGSSLNPELFKIKTLMIRGGTSQGEQGGDGNGGGDRQLRSESIYKINTW